MIIDIIFLGFILLPVIGVAKTVNASKTSRKVLSVIEDVGPSETALAALKLMDADHAFGFLVCLNPFAWSTKHHWPAAVEYLESMGIEVK